MPLYAVASGWNVALGSLVALDPQPQGDLVAPVVRNESASGQIHEIGGSVTLHYSTLEDEAMCLAVLTQYGLHNALTNQVTIYCRNGRMQWTRYNGVARLPKPNSEMKWSQYFARDIDVIINRLVAL